MKSSAYALGMEAATGQTTISWRPGTYWIAEQKDIRPLQANSGGRQEHANFYAARS